MYDQEQGECYRKHQQDDTKNDDIDSDDLTPEIDGWGLTSVFMTPAGLGFLYGFDLGATSFVLAHLFLQHHRQHSQQQGIVAVDDDLTQDRAHRSDRRALDRATRW